MLSFLIKIKIQLVKNPNICTFFVIYIMQFIHSHHTEWKNAGYKAAGAPLCLVYMQLIAWIIHVP